MYLMKREVKLTLDLNFCIFNNLSCYLYIMAFGFYKVTKMNLHQNSVEFDWTSTLKDMGQVFSFLLTNTVR